MICVAISEKNVDKCLSVLDNVEMAEIRLDLIDYDLEDIKRVFSHPTPLIATCRPDKIGNKDQVKNLSVAIEAGAKYVDIEVESFKSIQSQIIELARKNSCKVIISYHNYNETPGLLDLQKIIDNCFSIGADIAKLATLSKSNADNAKLLSLYSYEKPVIAIGMGETGKITRIMAPLLGAEFTFAAMDEGEATAPGQIKYSKMKKILTQLNEFI